MSKTNLTNEARPFRVGHVDGQPSYRPAEASSRAVPIRGLSRLFNAPSSCCWRVKSKPPNEAHELCSFTSLLRLQIGVTFPAAGPSLAILEALSQALYTFITVLSEWESKLLRVALHTISHIQAGQPPFLDLRTTRAPPFLETPGLVHRVLFYHESARQASHSAR